jgi:hypothetical protein
MLSVFPEMLGFYRLCQETNQLNPFKWTKTTY